MKRTRKRARETQKESERNQKDSERKEKGSARKQEVMKEGSYYETVGGREVRVKESRKRVKGSGSEVNLTIKRAVVKGQQKE